jgi:hypothetical protein
VLDLLERNRARSVAPLGRQDCACGLDGIAPLEKCYDNLRTGVLPAGIVDGDEVGIAANAHAMQDLPREVEQRMVRMGGRKGHDKGLLTCPPPTLLREQQLRVRFAPSQAAVALSIGVRRAPMTEVVRGTPPEATVRLATLLAATFRVASPIPSLALTGTATSGVGVVALTGANLMDAEAHAVGELSSTGRAAFSRHDLRRWAASHGRTPVGRPRRGCRATSATGRTRHRDSGRRGWQSRGGSVRPVVSLTADRRTGRRPPPADFPPTRLMATWGTLARTAKGGRGPGGLFRSMRLLPFARFAAGRGG